MTRTKKPRSEFATERSPSSEEIYKKLCKRWMSDSPDFVGTPDGHVIPWNDLRYYQCSYGGGSPLYAHLPVVSAEPTISEILMSNRVWIAFGRLAQERGHRAEIREFGALLVGNHVAFNRAAVALCHDMLPDNVEAECDVGPETLETYAKLSKKPRHRFDRAFLKFVIEAHDDEMSKLLLNVEVSPPLIEQFLSVLRHQLFVAEGLLRRRAGKDLLH